MNRASYRHERRTIHKHLQAHAESFAKAVATHEGEWIIKGFIEYKQRGIDTLQSHAEEIAQLTEDAPDGEEDEP